MAGIMEAVEALAAGKIEVNAAAEQIKAALTAGTEGVRPAPEDEGYGDSALQRFADKDDTGFDSSFGVVTAAWMGGKISDGQYHTIRDLVLPSTGEEKKPKDEKEETPNA